MILPILRSSFTQGRISPDPPTSWDAYYLVDIIHLLDLKWNIPEENLVGENADVPDIDLAIVELSFYHLR
jgi:hypothetical protein